ncbi:transposable element Tcb2 transposase [Trichonephila clavipes]|nr:transposable element Tcb2 transposase [Trichonephila clavipes]
MELLRYCMDFFTDLRSDGAFAEMFCGAKELADEIDIPANFEVTLPRHSVHRQNVNFDFEARDDPVEVNPPTGQHGFFCPTREASKTDHTEFFTARGGRVRSRTPAEDRYIVLSAKRNRRTTAQQVANQFLAASGKQISRKTVARRLRGGGLYARRPIVCVPLTRQHRTARLQWCRKHHNWTEQDWACVLFSDESRFSLSSDCRRQLIWRESGTAYRPENIQEKDRYPTCSIMVGAGIIINGRTRLHVGE